MPAKHQKYDANVNPRKKTNTNANLIPSPYAPFSHLHVRPPEQFPALTASVAAKLETTKKKYQKLMASKVEVVQQLHKEERKDEETLRAFVRKLQNSAPTDAPGHWQLRMDLEQAAGTTSKLAFCKQASHTLNNRRAMARQDFDLQKMTLDKRNVFTKSANAVRTSAGLNVQIHRRHNLLKVLKEVGLNAKRRRAIAPGAQMNKMIQEFAPKMPPK